jgi:[glutamine synthetase] adenylyltransferase / [glutamine synthetase]-adenylyl-L-tyrosine phosphorylase
LCEGYYPQDARRYIGTVPERVCFPPNGGLFHRARILPMEPRDLFIASQLPGEEVAAFLTGFGFLLPEQADACLQRIARLTGDPERLALLAPALLEQAGRSADPDAALLQLEGYLEAVPKPLSVVSFLLDNPVALEVLLRLLGASPYLSQVLVRNPEYFYWLVEGARFQKVPDQAYFLREAGEATQPFAGLATGMDALRRFRRRETLRIAAQDILGETTFEQTVLQISFLAEAVLEQTHRLLTASLPSPPRFAVFAMGKLGGRELNFSSDIDLIYLYSDDSDGDTALRFAREYNRLLSEYTEQGHLYRVDLRLRPMGKAGQIAYPLKACLHYYETWADTFDRLALVKCRWVAGDADLGERFIAALGPFVYKKYLDLAAVEEIRWIKKRTDRRLGRNDKAAWNVKLGLGGIREIEFVVQAFQLLYGGLHPDIRTTRTMTALDRLVDHGFIAPGQYRTLRQSYVFLREVEHKLQLVNDLQTHTLPRNEMELERCARRMGYTAKPGDPQRGTSLQWFSNELDRHSGAVREIFDTLFESGQRTSGLEEVVLNPGLSEAQAVERLQPLVARRPEQVHQGIKMLLEASSFPHSPSRMRNLLANLAPQLARNADLAENPLDLFNRLDRFCEALASRTELYAEMAENPSFGARLLKLLASGAYLAETLIRNPELLDALTVRVSGIAEEELAQFIDREHSQGKDARHALRVFKSREEFKIALDDLFVPGPDTRQRLSRLAEVCLRQALDGVLQKQRQAGSELALIALGKLGGEELTYQSDLDLLLVYDDRGNTQAAETWNEVARELKEELESYTEAGSVYRVDYRLRPEGKHGPPAVPMSALERYFENRAEPWERTAYVKGRQIFGRDFAVPLGPLVFRAPLSAAERSGLHRIRRRKEREIGREEAGHRHNFKVGRGGLLDLQFSVQYLQLQHSLPESNTGRALDLLIEKGHLDPACGDVLHRARRFLFRLETMQRLLKERSANSLPRDPEGCRRLALFLGLESGEALLEEYLKTTESVRQVYEKILGGDP